jgi:phosphatidate cytidylyltransferase
VFLGIVILIPVFNLSGIMMFKNWISLIIGLIVLNFSVDTAAWFWGKNFGKHKLWPAVSPKKTVEGFIGGILSSVIVTVIYWIIFVGNVNYQLVLSFFTIACCSQIGDLVQSKLKRQFEIKDSSNLIPGHGGVYDRVDSLLFVVPLYLWVLTNFLG